MAYLLSVLSSMLMLAVFRPLDWWWLAPVALVPYAYVLFAKDKFSLRESIISGLIVSVIFSLGMSMPALSQFHWYAMAEIMTIGMQLLWIPIVLLALVLGSLASWVGRKLQKDSFQDILLFSCIWTATEVIRRWLFLYFDYGLLGYSAHSVPFMMEFASVGGVLLISAILALINGLIAWIIHKGGLSLREAKITALLTSVLLAVYFLNHQYLYQDQSVKKYISVSTIQINDKEDPFGEFDKDNNFILGERTQNMIMAAALQEPDYLIYPFNLVGGILTDGSYSSFAKNLLSGTLDNFGDWTGSVIPAKTNFVMWTNTMRDGGNISAEVNFWNKNSLIAHYQKRKLFPFIDFTPAEVQRFGIYTTPLDFSAGNSGQMVRIGDINIGNLICSELNVSSLAASDSQKADIIFAIGSAAVFRDNIIGDRNIVLAQFRAAENNIPVVRADRKGPSAIIGSGGEILASMSFEKEGVLKSDIQINAHKRTLYSRLGDWLIIGLIAILFFYLIFFGKKPPARSR